MTGGEAKTEPTFPEEKKKKKPFTNEARDRSNEYTYTSLLIFAFSILMQHSSHMSCPGDQIHHSIDAAVYYLIDRFLAPGQSYLQENPFSPSFNASRCLHDDRPFIGNGGRSGLVVCTVVITTRSNR